MHVAVKFWDNFIKFLQYYHPIWPMTGFQNKHLIIMLDKNVMFT